jgi:ABC-type lipoprotein release transport system permease subunit
VIGTGRILRTCGALAIAAGVSVFASAEEPAPPDATPTVLVSRQLAARARLAVGDLLMLAADESGRDGRRFRIAGIYEPTPDPMRFNVERLEVRLHLDDLLALTAADRAAADAVTAINVALVDPADAPQLASDLSARNPLLLASPTARQDGGGVFVVLDRFHAAIAGVTITGSTAFLLALMVIRAEERRETIGILRLIGVSTRSILLEVVVEGLVVAVAGGLFGVALAAAAQHGVNAFFQARYDTTLVFVKVTPSIALRSVAAAVPVGVLAGVVASWSVLGRGPAALVKR